MKTQRETHEGEKTGREQSRGFVLIASYMVISVLSVFSLALLSRSVAVMDATERNINKMAAFNMADAAVHDAIVQLKKDPAYEGTNYVSYDNGVFHGGYEIEVETPQDNLEMRRILATGHAPLNDSSMRAYEARTIEAYVWLEPSKPFQFAVFADDALQLNGSPNVLVDSYNSTEGPYSVANRKSNGDIGTNSILQATVSIIGNAKVFGDAIVGPGGDPDEVITKSPNAKIFGDESAAEEPSIYPVVESEQASEGSLVVAGNTVYEMMAGEYHYDTFQVTGNGRVVARGPVIIYVDGEVNIAGNGIVTVEDLPPNFLMFVTTPSEVKIAGGADFYGAIYAPDAAVYDVGNGEIYGAIISNTYQQSGNGVMHYDEALKEIEDDNIYRVHIRSWREWNTAAAVSISTVTTTPANPGTGSDGGSGTPTAAL